MSVNEDTATKDGCVSEGGKKKRLNRSLTYSSAPPTLHSSSSSKKKKSHKTHTDGSQIEDESSSASERNEKKNSKTPHKIFTLSPRKSFSKRTLSISEAAATTTTTPSSQEDMALIRCNSDSVLTFASPRAKSSTFDSDPLPRDRQEDNNNDNVQKTDNSATLLTVSRSVDRAPPPQRKTSAHPLLRTSNSRVLTLPTHMLNQKQSSLTKSDDILTTTSHSRQTEEDVENTKSCKENTAATLPLFVDAGFYDKDVGTPVKTTWLRNVSTTLFITTRFDRFIDALPTCHCASCSYRRSLAFEQATWIDTLVLKYIKTFNAHVKKKKSNDERTEGGVSVERLISPCKSLWTLMGECYYYCELAHETVRGYKVKTTIIVKCLHNVSQSTLSSTDKNFLNKAKVVLDLRPSEKSKSRYANNNNNNKKCKLTTTQVAVDYDQQDTLHENGIMSIRNNDSVYLGKILFDPCPATPCVSPSNTRPRKSKKKTTHKSKKTNREEPQVPTNEETACISKPSTRPKESFFNVTLESDMHVGSLGGCDAFDSILKDVRSKTNANNDLYFLRFDFGEFGTTRALDAHLSSTSISFAFFIIKQAVQRDYVNMTNMKTNERFQPTRDQLRCERGLDAKPKTHRSLSYEEVSKLFTKCEGGLNVITEVIIIPPQHLSNSDVDSSSRYYHHGKEGVEDDSFEEISLCDENEPKQRHTMTNTKSESNDMLVGVLKWFANVFSCYSEEDIKKQAEKRQHQTMVSSTHMVNVNVLKHSAVIIQRPITSADEGIFRDFCELFEFD